jgi:hypothetical protein
MYKISYLKTFVGIAIGVCGCASGAFASLIQANPFEVSINGTGFGNVSTLITLQTANGQSDSEAGCIGSGGSTTSCGITQVGKIKNTSSTQPVPSGASASSLRFVFNAAQPAGSSITLNLLEVSFYGANGATLFNANLPSSPIILTSTQPGMGNSGFVFILDATEAAQAQAELAATTEIGAGFSATGASGGPDTVFLATAGGPSTVPEPATYSVVASGLLSLVLVRRRSRAKSPRS